MPTKLLKTSLRKMIILYRAFGDLDLSERNFDQYFQQNPFRNVMFYFWGTIAENAFWEMIFGHNHLYDWTDVKFWSQRSATVLLLVRAQNMQQESELFDFNHIFFKTKCNVFRLFLIFFKILLNFFLFLGKLLLEKTTRWLK